jgi:hypothetical protein
LTVVLDAGLDGLLDVWLGAGVGVVGLEVVELGVSVTLALAVLVLSATLVAVIVKFIAALMDAGAVYTPFTRVPNAGWDQVTEVL